MSLRLELGSCDLRGLRAALGSRRDDLVAAAVTDARARWDVATKDSDRLDTNLDVIVRRAIVDGAPFPDLEDESILHVAAADALARIAGAAQPVSEWSFKAMWLARMIQRPHLETQEFQWLVEGRPLFGVQFATNWAYYGFMTRDRVLPLAEVVSRSLTAAVFVADDAPLDGDEAMAQFARDRARAEQLLVEAGDSHDGANLEQWLLSLLDTEERSFLVRHWFGMAKEVLERKHGARAHHVLQERLYPAFHAWREDTPFTLTDRDELVRLGDALRELESMRRDVWFVAS